MNQYQLIPFEQIPQKTWDDFVLGQPSGSIHQIAAWKTFQEQIPGREQVMGFALLQRSTDQPTNDQLKDPSSIVDRRSDDKLLIACLCIKRGVGFGGKFWFYSPRGPVFSPDLTQEALDFFVTEVGKQLKTVGAMFWRLDPYFEAHSPFTIHHSHPATQQYQPTDSLVLDITGSEEEILAQMKRKGRYNIKLAREKGVEIQIIPGEKVTQTHLDQYWDLSQETAGRDGFATHDKAYHEKFVRELVPHTVLGFAKYEGKVIAGVINTVCGQRAIYYFGASSGDPQWRPLMAPYLLQWEMIRYAKSQGCKTYDFTGITPENEPNHPYKGITQFKLKFGGERATFAPAREIVFRKTWYFLYRAIKWVKP